MLSTNLLQFLELNTATINVSRLNWVTTVTGNGDEQSNRSRSRVTDSAVSYGLSPVLN